MQFPTAFDSPLYTPIQIVDRSPIRTDLRSPYPGDGVRFVDDDSLAAPGAGGLRRMTLRVAGLVAVLVLALGIGAALAVPTIEALAFRVTPSPEVPVLLKTE